MIICPKIKSNSNKTSDYPLCLSFVQKHSIISGLQALNMFDSCA